MTKKNTKKAGFSLIELLFAMLFLSIIVFGVIKLQTSNLTLSNTKQLELKAYTHATQGMEIVSAIGYGTIDGLYTSTDCDSPSPCNCEITDTGSYNFECQDSPETIGSIEFKRFFVVELEADGSALVNAYLVTSNVGWTDSSGDHNVSVKRIISD